MQTKKPSNYQDLKKSICKNYIKDGCQYGRECKFRHPPKHQENETEVCKYFLQNKCRRGDECPFVHRKPKPEKKQRSDWLTFCLYFPNGQCKNKECRFLHITEEDKDVFRTSGKIGPHLLEQGMCKALLQDVTLDGNTPTCKDYLQGSCEWMSCPMLHLTRPEFSQAILGILTEKFEAVLGQHEVYHAHSKGASKSSFRYQDPHGYDMSPGFKDQWEQERYTPASNESYGNSYGKKPSWYNERISGRPTYNQQDFISSETDRIITGIYNLMRGDATFMRNTGKQEITDLRGKLNHLAEENVRYRYECSRQYPYEGEGYKPLIPMVPGTDDYKYQDVVRRLERENMEMRRQLSRIQERDQNPYHGGRYNMPQESHHREDMRGQGHVSYDRRMYGLPKPVTNYGPTYNPLKQKVNTQIKHNMLQQYKKPQHAKQGAPHYGKVNYPKYQKPIQQSSKKNPQQTQKTQLNQIKKKKPQGQSQNHANSEDTDNITKDKEGEGDRKEESSGASGESEAQFDGRDSHSPNNVENLSEGETRIKETRTEENEKESEAIEQDVTKEDLVLVQEENSSETREGPCHEDDTTESEEASEGAHSKDDTTESEEASEGARSKDDTTESEEASEGARSKDDTTESEEASKGASSKDDTTESEEASEGACSKDNTTESAETREDTCNTVEKTKPEIQKEDREKKEEKIASYEEESEASKN